MRIRAKDRAGSACTVRQASTRQRSAHSRRESDPSVGLIAPANFLRLPSLRGVQFQYTVRRDMELALKPLEVLVDKGYVRNEHIEGAKDVVEILIRALKDMLASCWCDEGFEIHFELSSEEWMRKAKKEPLYLCFSWTNGSMQYMALDTVVQRLGNAPQYEKLMATFYWLIYGAACAVTMPFSLNEAKAEYEIRQDYLAEEREQGEEPLAEELADPNDCPVYLKEASRLKFAERRIKAAFDTIPDEECRALFLTCLEAYKLSKTTKLSKTIPELEYSVENARYYDGASQIGLALGVDRKDNITAWIDEYQQDLYNSGCDPAPTIVRGYRPDDYQAFAQLFEALPRMVKLIGLLNKCVMTVEEWEKCTSK